MPAIQKRLSEKGIQPSIQRLKILKLISESADHLDAATIYERLRLEIPTLSKTTVYNTLNTFAEKGLVNPITITGDETRYDHSTDSHHHLFCRVCKSIIDVNVCCDYATTREIAGHSIEEIHGYFKGVCKGCFERGRTKIKE
jgi:Fur family transcriptional regulator, peroxide stress response regulator